MSGNQAQAGNNVGVGGGSGGGGSGAGSSGGSSSQHIQQHQQLHQQQQHTPPQIITSVTAGTTTSTMAVAGSSSSADANNMAADSSPRESGDDSEDESEILEESPCGRWLKRREEVDQRDVPGIDCVHLAMDTEEGVEVVWNEVQYASLQELKSQEDKMRQVFDNLLQLDHQNIVKFHRYWTDTQHPDRPRVIFITEFMSSGSLKQFLKRTKRNAKRLPLEAWRRWCTQILSALSYLHSCTPPIIHGNLTCDSIFIQHNGLVKIGTVVPDAVHYSVRQQQHKDVDAAQHFMAPEYGAAEQLTDAVDIYAFGMCALEMAALEIQNSAGETSTTINDETILRTINSLEHDLQRDLIFKCLRRNPYERPNASDLLFHPLLFEVHSLKLLAAHSLIFSPKNRTMFSETVIDGMMQKYNRPDVVMAHIQWTASSIEKDVPQNPEAGAAASTPEEQSEQQPQKQKVPKITIKEYRLSDVPSADKLEKFVEDVKFGVYPLTAFSGKKPPHFRSRASSPERADSVKSATPEPVDIESRRIVNMMCSVKKLKEGSSDILMTILLRMDDKMNRQLSCDVTDNDTASDLTQELVRLGFVHIDDQDKIQALLEETLRSTFSEGGAAFGEFGAQERTFSATINEPSNIINNATSNNNNNNNNSSNNNNNNSNAMMMAKTLPANPSMTSLNQMERNWSIADPDAAAATASLMMQQQNQTQQQQQHQQQQQLSSTALTTAMPTTAAAATALGLTGTVTVPIVDPLAGHVMYVPHEQIQQHQQQQQQSLQHIPQHQHSPPQHYQPQQQQLHHHIDPSKLSMDVVDNPTSHHHHQQQQQQQQQQHQQQQHHQHYINPAVNASSITSPHLTNYSASPLPLAISTSTTTSTSSTTTIN